MEQPKSDLPKLPDMVSSPAVGNGGVQFHRVFGGSFLHTKAMCGDHPSFTKTELNVKESKEEKDKFVIPKISPSTSRTANLNPGGEKRSEHALRMIEARRRVRSMETVPRADIEVAPGNRALIQAALGSFRWPPYLLAVWVVVLIVTHLLHCVVTMLERALPNVKKFSQYFRQWTEEAWKQDSEVNHRVYPLALAMVTGLLYTLYYALYVLYSVTVWAIEPLAGDMDDKQSTMDVFETKVTEYDECGSKTNVKH